MNDETGTPRGDDAEAWLPQRTLRIGVTGHRPARLGSSDLDKLHVEVSRILAEICSLVSLHGPTEIRLVSPLAEGADSIVADAALERGWALDAVLPFFRDDYAQDFAPGQARDAHLRRLAQAAAVFELPGERSGEGGEAAAYERAGRITLAQSDLLLAIWDSEPMRGRGGAAQIVAEAVLQGIPVIHVDPADKHPPVLLWDGLEEIDLGQQTIDTVARGDVDKLGALLGQLLDLPVEKQEAAMLERFRSGATGWQRLALAYPLLLAVAGVRRLRRTDFGWTKPGDTGAAIPTCTGTQDFADRLDRAARPSFARADAAATRFAQLFRSGYVTNFMLAAFAVLLSMLGLAMPAWAKPELIVLEVLTIATILLVTRMGNKAGWHRLWLDNRALAERLRCVALSAQLGDLDLRGAGEQAALWVAWYTRASARLLGLPSIRADRAYLECVRSELRQLIQGQIAYLNAEARRMHLLDHRLHLTGTILFAITALACVSMLIFKGAYELVPALYAIQYPFSIGVTIVSAALPAIGAAIYGIRMQGDFAGIAARGEALRHDLETLAGVIDADTLSFDTLLRRARRVTDLLAGDLASWLRAYHARPLTLPG
ncbi:hypothetical protein IAG41_01360 [Sphingomonas sp. JC676]|uniref:hypothetical protein n=1 Tax=Sphingomonas sp. JC676 TaxID=2768065 RepID=UPI001657C27F|nr:hypothetical protein [Sphingomonas sp. JC676]MBC9031030.1 hypothetical protein [Sphingomonas sp. JC676]